MSNSDRSSRPGPPEGFHVTPGKGQCLHVFNQGDEKIEMYCTTDSSNDPSQTLWNLVFLGMASSLQDESFQKAMVLRGMLDATSKGALSSGETREREKRPSNEAFDLMSDPDLPEHLSEEIMELFNYDSNKGPSY